MSELDKSSAVQPAVPSAPRTARERVRSELTSEIKAVALAQLASGGGAALSLRAIAREMGMASSALFRYFRSRDALLTALIIDSYSSLAEAAETAEAQVHLESIEDRWMAICRGVRNWAVAHPHEYALIFGSPIPGYAAPPGTIGPPPGCRCCWATCWATSCRTGPMTLARTLSRPWPSSAR